MRKKLICLLLMLSTALALAGTAAADVIWEPQDDFYSKHREECEYVGRIYQTAGAGESVTLWDSPEAKRAFGTAANAQQGMVQFVWRGEMEWGYVYGLGEDGSEAGWVPMDELSLVYDSRQFEEDHAQEITVGDPAPADFSACVLYSYPNGPVKGELAEHEGYMPFEQVFTQTYRDEAGKNWGYVGYYMGHRRAWVCLDDPMNGELDTAVVEVQPSAAQKAGQPALPKSSNVPATGDVNHPLLLIGVLVLALSAVTLTLILKLPKKRT